MLKCTKKLNWPQCVFEFGAYAALQHQPHNAQIMDIIELFCDFHRNSMVLPGWFRECHR